MARNRAVHVDFGMKGDKGKMEEGAGGGLACDSRLIDGYEESPKSVQYDLYLAQVSTQLCLFTS